MKPKGKKAKAKKMVGRRVISTPTPKAEIMKGMQKYGM